MPIQSKRNFLRVTVIVWGSDPCKNACSIKHIGAIVLAWESDLALVKSQLHDLATMMPTKTKETRLVRLFSFSINKVHVLYEAILPVLVAFALHHHPRFNVVNVL
eukprot:6478330-Amphidinium_carterae.1